ncbi:hypothetical protein [Flavobacterium subsaxonicum]|uniref:Uncharacterized protein n=1 Tax=Flavobacterium subsaxonicum WB 4.1-42 = DSM 21790 TaxID=1121898 RepID=A0A0A2MYP7_9FLAO|nr:hypothetical protein [Flavobacterium subsaxonicum]KGO93345.1 hypothetical protein Q766_08555 [Flavobacterium subsaxonicum WB 4.1-42 = DSM 21790]
MTAHQIKSVAEIIKLTAAQDTIEIENRYYHKSDLRLFFDVSHDSHKDGYVFSYEVDSLEDVANIFIQIKKFDFETVIDYLKPKKVLKDFEQIYMHSIYCVNLV